MNSFDDKFVSEEIKRRYDISKAQVTDMVDRAIRCPHCGFIMAYAYNDLHSGHISMKCPKCKNISPFNLGLFKCQAEPKKYLGVHTLPDFAS